MEAELDHCYLVCSESGTAFPEAISEDLSAYRFIEEQEKDKQEKIVVGLSDGELRIRVVSVETEPAVEREFFEKGWGAFLVKEG